MWRRHHTQGRQEGTIHVSSPLKKGSEYLRFLRHLIWRGGGCGDDEPCEGFLLGTGGGFNGFEESDCCCTICLPGGGAGGWTLGGKAGGGYEGGPPTGVTDPGSGLGVGAVNVWTSSGILIGKGCWGGCTVRVAFGDNWTGAGDCDMVTVGCGVAAADDGVDKMLLCNFFPEPAAT